MRWFLEFDTTTWPACGEGALDFGGHGSVHGREQQPRRVARLAVFHGADRRRYPACRRPGARSWRPRTSCRRERSLAPSHFRSNQGWPCRNLMKCWPTMPVAPRMPTSMRVCIIALPCVDRFRLLRAIALWPRALRACAPRGWSPARSGTARPTAPPNAGISVVKATTVVGMPSSAFSRSGGDFDAPRAVRRGPPRRAPGPALVSAESPTRRIMISARASSAITLGARPPEMVPMFSVLGPSSGSTGSGMRAHIGQRVEQLVDGRIAQLGISRVRHLAGGDDFIAQRALGAERQLVFGGLAVDDVARAARRAGPPDTRRRCCAPRPPRTAGRNRARRLRAAPRRRDHGGDDALGVAGAAAPDVVVVLARGEERRHGIHVGGKRDGERLAPLREHVEAARLHFHALERAAEPRGQRRQVVEQVTARPAPRCW